MPHTNDKPSERAVNESALDEITRKIAERPAERTPQRIVIRTAENRFDIPADEIPTGMDYGWKIVSVNGKEDREAIIAWTQNGWRPVPAGRHPRFTGENPDSQAKVERGGLVLCERPKELTAQSAAMDKQNAADLVRTQMDRLAGRARETGSQRVTTLKSKYEPITDET